MPNGESGYSSPTAFARQRQHQPMNPTDPAEQGTGSQTPDAALPSPPADAPRAVADEGEVIVVTATKRAENLQDVPIAITAITTKTLDDLQPFDPKRFAEHLLAESA